MRGIVHTRWCAAAPLLAVLLLAFSSAAEANVFGSPHDLYRQGYLTAPPRVMRSNPQCQVCHLEPADDRPLIWKVVPPSLNLYGEVGILCTNCHDGVSMMDRNVDAGLTVFHPASHGLDPTRAPAETDMVNTGLPYIVGDKLKCDTCHDPHSQVRRPFMRVPVIGLCSRCHQGRRHAGFGFENDTGNHPVSIEPFDNTGGASPIDLQADFAVAFPKQYPLENAILSTVGHWRSGGHLGFGHYGKIECTTCHAFHGLEGKGPVGNLLAKDPVKDTANEFCEGCHRGERGDENPEPPYPNPGGTITGRTYHPVDDDEANGIGRLAAIADSTDLAGYDWGGIDPESEEHRILCTTCHRAHGGMENSPALVRTNGPAQDAGVKTFCEICHREPPPGHHGYEDISSRATSITIPLTSAVLGRTYGTPEPNQVYCSHCHRAHNAGYGLIEAQFTPILVDKGQGLCEACHAMGVSHFMGDPTLPSTYEKIDPPLKRDPWPNGGSSFYEGEGLFPNTVTCLSCHDLSSPPPGQEPAENRLLAPASEDAEWPLVAPDEYLCTGCHGGSPATVGSGTTHPLMTADSSKYPIIKTNQLVLGEFPATYSENGAVNCLSCHRAHGTTPIGGVYILKVVRGTNTDPKAIRPTVDYANLCDSCHPYL